MDIENKSSLVKDILRVKAFRRYVKKLTKISLPDYSTFGIFAVIIDAFEGLASVLFHNL